MEIQSKTMGVSEACQVISFATLSRTCRDFEISRPEPTETPILTWMRSSWVYTSCFFCILHMSPYMGPMQFHRQSSARIWQFLKINDLKMDSFLSLSTFRVN